MIVNKVYKITYQDEIALVDRVIRSNIEDAFDVMDAPATSVSEFIGDGIIERLTEKIEECFHK